MFQRRRQTARFRLKAMNPVEFIRKEREGHGKNLRAIVILWTLASGLWSRLWATAELRSFCATFQKEKATISSSKKGFSKGWAWRRFTRGLKSTIAPERSRTSFSRLHCLFSYLFLTRPRSRFTKRYFFLHGHVFSSITT
jgi:hypothetical protein